MLDAISGLSFKQITSAEYGGILNAVKFKRITNWILLALAPTPQPAFQER